MFIHVERLGNLPILQSFRNPANDLLLSLSEQKPSLAVGDPGCRAARKGFKEVSHLLAVGPHLSAVHTSNAFT